MVVEHRCTRCSTQAVGSFITENTRGGAACREALLSRQDVMDAATRGSIVACEAKVEEALVGISINRTDEPLAGDALPFALDRIATGDFEDAATLDANYLRRTDAEIFAKPAVRAE